MMIKMSDGITDSRKKISEEQYLRMESYRIKEIVRELKEARAHYKKHKEEYKKEQLRINKEK